MCSLIIFPYISFLLQVPGSDRGDSDHGDAGDGDHSDIGGSTSDITRSEDDDASLVELREALKVAQAQITALTEKLQRVKSENTTLQEQVSGDG